MATHLVRWDERYRDAGLVILNVDNGDIDSKQKLERHVEEDGLPYPVAWDEAGETCRRYGVQAFPAAYLLDREGKVVFEGLPNVAVEKLEARIRELLGVED